MLKIAVNKSAMALLFFIIKVISAETERICGGDTATISCSNGKVILISEGFYGRQSAFLQGCVYFPNPIACFNPTAHQIISEKCNNAMECTLTASNDIFGDPCSGIPEYIDVRYLCVDKESESITPTKSSFNFTNTTWTTATASTKTMMSQQVPTTLITIACVVIVVVVVIATTGLVCFRQFRPNKVKQNISEQSATSLTISNEINPESQTVQSQTVQPEGGNNIEPAYISQPLQDDQQNHGVSIMSTQENTNALFYETYENSRSIELEDLDSNGYISPTIIPQSSNGALVGYEVPIKRASTNPELDGYLQPMKISPFPNGSYIEFNSSTGNFETSDHQEYKIIPEVYE